MGRIIAIAILGAFAAVALIDAAMCAIGASVIALTPHLGAIEAALIFTLGLGLIAAVLGFTAARLVRNSPAAALKSVARESHADQYLKLIPVAALGALLTAMRRSTR